VGGPTACPSLAGREEDDASIDETLFDDEHWVEDFDGPDPSLEEAGIVITPSETGE
jgi:hypothetical protein